MEKVLSEILDSYHPEMVEKLQELIRIKSVLGEAAEDAPFGKEIQRSLEFILQLGKSKGFECINFENYACELNLGKGEESVGVVSHLDVVPEGSGWTVNPFEGEIINQNIYGRGAVDDKGPLIAVFYACCAIKDSGLPLKKKIKHIIGTNEEKGVFPCIRYYKEHGEVPACGFVPDSWFPVAFAEKGFLDFQFTMDLNDPEPQGVERVRLIELKGGEALNIVAPSAYAVFKVDEVGKELVLKALENLIQDGEINVEENGELLTIRAAGKAAHASVPQNGDNAISKILCALERIQFNPSALCITLHRLADIAGKDYDGAGLGIKCEDHTGALTNNLGIITYKEGSLCLKMNIRSPISIKPETIAGKLADNAEKINMKCELLNYNPHFYMPEDHPLICLLTEVYQEMTGDTQTRPVAHGGGSYARILDNFVPFGPSIMGEELCFHKQDEFIACERLLLLSKIYAEALYRLANS